MKPGLFAVVRRSLRIIANVSAKATEIVALNRAESDGFAQDPAVTPGLGYAFVLVVVVVVRTGRPPPATAYVGVQLSVDHSLA